ncbi:MAG: MBL fold metallo-hydrolase RNA specificity domain-containing protein [Homoserinimonas sp.]
MANGERALRIFGTDVPSRAEVIQMHNLSAHADADEVIAWMRTAMSAPMTTFVTHGEPQASDAMRISIARELGWNARVPEMGEFDEGPDDHSEPRHGGKHQRRAPSGHDADGGGKSCSAHHESEDQPWDHVRVERCTSQE